MHRSDRCPNQGVAPRCMLRGECPAVRSMCGVGLSAAAVRRPPSDGFAKSRAPWGRAYRAASVSALCRLGLKCVAASPARSTRRRHACVRWCARAAPMATRRAQTGRSEAVPRQGRAGHAVALSLVRHSTSSLSACGRRRPLRAGPGSTGRRCRVHSLHTHTVAHAQPHAHTGTHTNAHTRTRTEGSEG